jgi:hypothetical protein
MAEAKRVKWVCPDCEGAVLAPTRLALADVRRFCLPCSERTGLLVSRSAPVLDRKRAQSKARSAKKQATKRRRVSTKKAAEKKRVAERWTMGGFDYRRELQVLWRIVQRHQIGRHWQNPCPRIELTTRGQDGWSWAHRGGLGASTIRMSPYTDSVYAWESLAHEVAHCAVGRVDGKPHSTAFYKAIARIIRARFGLDVSFSALRTARGYTADAEIRRQLHPFKEWCDALKAEPEEKAATDGP